MLSIMTRSKQLLWSADTVGQCMTHRLVLVVMDEVRDDPKLSGSSGEVRISEWSGW